MSVIPNLEKKRNKSGRIYYYVKMQIPFDELKALGLEELAKQLLVKKSIDAVWRLDSRMVSLSSYRNRV